MYQPVTPEFYRILQPNDLTHAGSRGWSHAPVPGWGVNPLRVGPPMLGATEEEKPLLTPFKFPKPTPLFAPKKKKPIPKVIALPPPTPFVPYPVYRQVPPLAFSQYAYVVAGPTGRFPNGPAYDAPPSEYCPNCFNGIGAYYENRTKQAIGAYYENRTKQAIGAVDPVVAFAAIALGGVALYVGILGGIGYVVGGAVAPDKQSEKSFRWAGAIGNTMAPGIGLAIGLGIAALAAKGK